MKLKTINSVICKKFDAWCASIQDEAVRKLVQDNSVCTGGAIASMLLGEDVNDFDFYFRDFDTVKAVAGHYVKQFKANPPPNGQRSSSARQRSSVKSNRAKHQWGGNTGCARNGG